MAARLADVTVELPELHSKQLELFATKVDRRANDPTVPAELREGWAQNSGGRFLAARCGRRFGKTLALETWEAKGAAKGQRCGWFAPNYKYIREVYQDLIAMLEPVLVSSSRTENVLRTTTGGLIDFWTLEDERAGRSRFYDRAGDEVDFDGRERLIAVELEALRHVPVTIAVAVGQDKISSIIAGARGGYFNQLVTDPATATAILATVKNDDDPAKGAS